MGYPRRKESVYLQLALRNALSHPRLARVAESSSVSNDPTQVVDYDKAISARSSYHVLLASCLYLLGKIRLPPSPARAIDLASGPGHFSLLLSKALGFREVLGLDLAPNMVEIARTNARIQAQAGTRFQIANIADLNPADFPSADLVTFTNAAHHLESIDQVRQALASADRIAKPEGYVFLFDLARLKTRSISEKYVETAGRDYLERGLFAFYDDFHQSTLAAWSPLELGNAIPNPTKRVWCHLVARGIPIFQAIFGLPVGTRRLDRRSLGTPYQAASDLVPEAMAFEWLLIRLGLRFAHMRYFEIR